MYILINSLSVFRSEMTARQCSPRGGDLYLSITGTKPRLWGNFSTAGKNDSAYKITKGLVPNYDVNYIFTAHTSISVFRQAPVSIPMQDTTGVTATLLSDLPTFKTSNCDKFG